MSDRGELHAGLGVEGSGRTRLSVEQFAGKLDHRLHYPHLRLADLEVGCRFALEHGLAAVICRPDQVPEVAQLVGGAGIGLVTALDFYADSKNDVADDWTPEASRLADHGATELAVVASAAQLAAANRDTYMERLRRLLALGDAGRFRVRVHIDVKGLTDDQLEAAAREFAQAGVWMVQAGSWANERSAFRSLLLIRAALGADVLLKWTTPVSSYQVMLLAIAEGVDRFNGDAEQLLRAFTRESRVAPLSVPLAGLDY